MKHCDQTFWWIVINCHKTTLNAPIVSIWLLNIFQHTGRTMQLLWLICHGNNEKLMMKKKNPIRITVNKMKIKKWIYFLAWLLASNKTDTAHNVHWTTYIPAIYTIHQHSRCVFVVCSRNFANQKKRETPK